MKIVAVEFEGTPNKRYFFKTKLNLIKDGIYDIIADERTTYNNRVKIRDFVHISEGNINKNLRVITSAKLLQAPPKPKPKYKKIYVDRRKKTICILWKDGTKTVMKPQPEDEFDLEKGIAMCFMKKVYNNRGCFNDVFKDIEIVY